MQLLYFLLLAGCLCRYLICVQARALIAKLTEEKNNAMQQYNKLRQELVRRGMIWRSFTRCNFAQEASYMITWETTTLLLRYTCKYLLTITQMKIFTIICNFHFTVGNKIMILLFCGILDYQGYISFLWLRSALCRNYWSMIAGKMQAASPSCSSYLSDWLESSWAMLLRRIENLYAANWNLYHYIFYDEREKELLMFSGWICSKF